jgi:hypothetical protein
MSRSSHGLSGIDQINTVDHFISVDERDLLILGTRRSEISVKTQPLHTPLQPA